MLEGPQPFQIREIDGAPPVFEDDVKLYLLDGQQRVTALYHALTGTSHTAYYADFSDLDENERPSLKWAKKSPSSNAASASRVPFSILLREDLFDALAQEVPQHVSDWMYEARRVLVDDDLGSAYSVPAIVMEQAISLEALTRIFETLNRTGVRLNSFDLMVAVLYPSGFNLREEWNAARATSAALDQFDSSGLEILKLIALWQKDEDQLSRSRPASRRVTGIRQRDVLNIPPESVERWWKRAIAAYSDALGMCSQSFGIQGSDGLPSETMVLALAYFIDRGIAEGTIRRWYWASVAMQTYAQGANTQIIIDTRSGSPELPPITSVEAALRADLGDEVRRNKILRLGVRALSVLHDDGDPATGMPFRGSVVEVSLTALLEDRVAVDGDAAVADLVFVSKESIKVLRKRRTAGERLMDRIDFDTLLRQGFESMHDTESDLLDGSAGRVQTLVTRFLMRMS